MERRVRQRTNPLGEYVRLLEDELRKAQEIINQRLPRSLESRPPNVLGVLNERPSTTLHQIEDQIEDQNEDQDSDNDDDPYNMHPQRVRQSTETIERLRPAVSGVDFEYFTDEEVTRFFTEVQTMETPCQVVERANKFVEGGVIRRLTLEQAQTFNGTPEQLAGVSLIIQPQSQQSTFVDNREDIQSVIDDSDCFECNIGGCSDIDHDWTSQKIMCGSCSQIVCRYCASNGSLPNGRCPHCQQPGQLFAMGWR